MIDEKNVKLYVMKKGSNIDIDTMEGWEKVEKILAKRKKVLKIGNRLVGDGQPAFIIAEIGTNWRVSENMDENFQQALKLIDKAAEAGADAVKFQLFRSKKMYAPNAGQAEYLK